MADFNETGDMELSMLQILDSAENIQELIAEYERLNVEDNLMEVDEDIPPPSPVRIDTVGTSINGVPSPNVQYDGHKITWPPLLKEIAALSHDSVKQLLHFSAPRIAERLRRPYARWYDAAQDDCWDDLEELKTAADEFFEYFTPRFEQFCEELDAIAGTTPREMRERLMLMRELKSMIQHYYPANRTCVGLRSGTTYENIMCVREFPHINSPVMKILSQLPAGRLYMADIIRELLTDYTLSSYIVEAMTNEEEDDLNATRLSATWECLPKAEAGVGQEDVVMKEMNTTFSDERPEEYDTGHRESQVERTAMQVSMPESEWHIRNVMEKPLLFYNEDWSTSNPRGTIKTEAFVPGGTLVGVHDTLCQSFTFWRGHPKIRVQVNGTKFHAGRLMAVFIPSCENTNVVDLPVTVSMLTSYPHVILDASASNSGELDIPFVHMNSYLNLLRPRDYQSLGKFVVCVLNTLTAAGGATNSISVSAWVSYQQCELHQPLYQHTVRLPKSMPKAEMQVDGNTISRWVPNVVSGLAHGSGLDKSERLSLDPNSQVKSTSITTGRDGSDMNLLSLCQIPTRCHVASWTQAMAGGARFAHLAVYPSMCELRVDRYDLTPKVIQYRPTLLAYISRAFKYWRGSLRYKIQVISSQMHTGRMLISYGAGLEVGAKDLSLLNLSILNSCVMDLQEKHEIEVEIPFFAERPWLRCDKLTGANKNLNYGDSNAAILGYLDLTVVNRLTCPSNTTQSVEVNIFLSAGPDFELAFPTDLSYFYGYYTPTPPKAVEDAKKVEMNVQHEVSTREEHFPVRLGRGNGHISYPAGQTMTEGGMDMRKVVQRFMPVNHTYNHSIADTELNYFQFANTPMLGSDYACWDNKRAYSQRTQLAHFSSLFAYWRGSLRYKVVYTTSTGTSEPPKDFLIKVVHQPGVYPTGRETWYTTKAGKTLDWMALENQGVIVASTKVQGSLEFEVPFVSPYQLLQVMTDKTGTRTSTGVVNITIMSAISEESKATKLNMTIYQAAGADFELVYLKGPWSMIFYADSETNRLLSDDVSSLYNGEPPSVCASDIAAQEEEEESFFSPDECIARAEMFAAVRGAVHSVVTMPGNVNTTLNTVNTAAAQVSSVLTSTGLTGPSTEEATEETDEADGTVDSPIQLALNVLAGFLKELPSSMGPLKSITSWTVSVANLVTGFNSYVSASSLLVKALAIVTIVSELFGSAINFVKSRLLTLTQSMLQIINGCKQGNEQPIPEMFILDFVPALLATLGVGAAAIGFKHIPSDKEASDMVRSVNDRLRLFNGSSLALTNVKKLWAELKGTVEWITDWILEQVSPQVLAQLKLHRGFEEVEKWAASIDAIYTADYVDRANWDLEYRNKILSLNDVADRVSHSLIAGKIGREASVLREYLKKVREMTVNVMESEQDLPSRIDPYCICFYGDPGVGKSACVMSVAAHVMDALDYPLHNRMCSVNPSDKFFSESYNNQAAVYIDDLSTFTSEEQYQSFMGLKSNAKLPLNMAFNKGKTFTSHFIFCTTNVSHPAPPCLLTPKALWRRRDALIQMQWIPGRPHERTEDYRNSEFRWLSAMDMNGQHTPWVSYQRIKEQIVRNVRPYMINQRCLVRRNLLDQHYIPPPGLEPMHNVQMPAIPNLDVEGDWQDDVFEDAVEVVEDIIQPEGTLRLWAPTLNKEELENDFIANAYIDDGIFEQLVWENDEAVFPQKGRYVLRDTATTEQAAVWSQMVRFWNHTEDVQSALYRMSITSPVKKVKIVLSGMLKDFKNWLSDAWANAKSQFPWLDVLETWPVKLAAALVTLGGVSCAIVKTVHTCICRSLRFMGYRCAQCGMWPDIKDCKDKEWLLQEWQEMYGTTTEYESGRVTSLAEERSFAEMEEEAVPQRPTRGTKAKRRAEVGPYSQDVKGGKMIKVVANTGPYSQDVKGQAVQKIVANVGQSTDDLIQHRIAPYIYRIRSTHLGRPIEMNAFAVGGRKILIIKHFADLLTDSFEIFHSQTWMRVNYDLSKVVEFPGKDLVIYDMPVQFHLHKDLSKHFVSEKDLGKLALCKGYLIQQLDESQIIIREKNRIKAEKEVAYFQDSFGESVEYRVQRAWVYDAQSSPGSCGSVLMTTSDLISGKILGIHVCGTNLRGWSQLITREMIAPLITSHLGTPLPEVEVGTAMKLSGHFGMIGKVPVEGGIYQAAKTQIIPTEIHGMISSPATFPSVLSSKDARLSKPTNVMRKAIEKYGEVPRQFPQRHLDMVFEAIEADIANWDVQRAPAILSQEEAVVGLDLEGFDRLPMNTSPGYPYVLSRPAGQMGKAYLFDVETGKVSNAELKAKLESRLSLAQRGERCVSVWSCCLKDERRSLPKIEAGSTRLFVIPPVDLSIVTRMYTLDFSVAIKDNRHQSFTQVGIDTQSLEWTQIYNRLAAHSKIVVAGDFSKFDGTIPPELTHRYMMHCDNFYKTRGEWREEDQLVRMVLADESAHTVHITGRDIFLNHTGNESGDPNTVNKNSFTNKYYISLAWLHLAEKHAPEKATMAAFKRDVVDLYYGDDNLIAIKPEVTSWFNQETIANYLSQFGIIYTNESKTGITRFSSLDEVTFLKCAFVNHESLNGVKVPRINEQTILELLNWTRIAPDQEELLESNCNDALRFAYFYGRDYFTTLRGKIVRALLKKDLKFHVMTYSDFHYWFLYVIGCLPKLPKAEAFFEKVASNGNGKLAQMFGTTLQKLPYKLISWMGLLQTEDESIVRDDDRNAIAIPSGEGKSWLCKHFPEIFVDHDDLLLPAARRLLKENGVSLQALRKMFDLEFPIDDRRVLLVHHPNNTKRQILGRFLLPQPNFIRANAVMRLRLKNAEKLERTARNCEILRRVSMVEPTLPVPDVYKRQIK